MRREWFGSIFWRFEPKWKPSEIKPPFARTLRYILIHTKKKLEKPYLLTLFSLKKMTKKIKQITHLEPTRPVHRHFVVVILTIWETKEQRQPLQQPGFVARYQKQYLSAPKQPQIAARGCQYPRDTWPRESKTWIQISRQNEFVFFSNTVNSRFKKVHPCANILETLDLEFIVR